MSTNLTRAICEDCGETININEQIVYQKKYKLDETIYLTYYDCSKCKKRHFVQIDNDETINLLNESKKRFITLSKAKISNKKPSKRQVEKFNLVRHKLSELRLELTKKYQGKEINDENKTFNLKFSI